MSSVTSLSRALALAGLALAAAASPARADTLHDEAVLGDFSNNGLAPTVLVFGSGANQVLGSSGNNGGVDRDYFSFTVPAGQLWTALTVLPGSAPLGTTSFLGIQAGPQVTVVPTAGTAAGLLGWTLWSADTIGVDILPMMTFPELGSSGFTIPLGAGTYSMWAQEGSAGLSPYGFDFTLTPVPEMPTVALLAAGLLALGLRRRR